MTLVRFEGYFTWQDRARAYCELAIKAPDDLTRWGYETMASYCRRKSMVEQFSKERNAKLFR